MDTDNTETYLALRRCTSSFLSLFRFSFLLDHAEKRVTPSLKFLWTPAFEEPVETENRELGNVLLYPLVHVIGTHTVVIQPTKEIAVLFFGIDFAFRRRIVEL